MNIDIVSTLFISTRCRLSNFLYYSQHLINPTSFLLLDKNICTCNCIHYYNKFTPYNNFISVKQSYDFADTVIHYCHYYVNCNEKLHAHEDPTARGHCRQNPDGRGFDVQWYVICVHRCMQYMYWLQAHRKLNESFDKNVIGVVWSQVAWVLSQIFC